VLILLALHPTIRTVSNFGMIDAIILAEYGLRQSLPTRRWIYEAGKFVYIVPFVVDGGLYASIDRGPRVCWTKREDCHFTLVRYLRNDDGTASFAALKCKELGGIYEYELCKNLCLDRTSPLGNAAVSRQHGENYREKNRRTPGG